MESKTFWTPINRMTTIYFLTWGFSAMDRLLVAMLFPFILPYFKLSFAQGGLLMACMSIGYLIVAFAGGMLSDRYGRRKVILPSVFVFSIGSALTGFAGSFAQMVGIRSIVGAGEGSFNMAATAQIAEECPPEKRGVYIGFYTSAFALFGSFVAPIYATQVASRWGWQWACYLTIIPGIILALVIWGMVKETKRFATPVVAARPKASWGQVMKVRNIVVACLLGIFWMVWLWSWLSFGTVFFVNVKHLTTGVAGIMQSALGAGGFLGMIAVPALSDKLGRRVPLIVGTILGLLGTLAIVYLPGGAFALTYLALFVTAFVTWGCAPIIISVIPSESVPTEWIASGIALVTCLAELAGIAVAPPILGAIGDKFGLSTTMLCGGAALIPVLLLSAFVLRETAPRFAAVKAQAVAAVH
ncbi:MAG: MFS transporter [Candidatus Korobacteraceae bacterium]|jgi:MFS family permease